MVRVIGSGIIPEARAFDDLKKVIDFNHDIYLGAFWARPLRIELKNKVIYNTEFLYDESPLFSIGYLETLRKNIVLDYDAKNVEYLKNIGIDAFHMPYGYHKSLERKVESKKDIDVLFVGSNKHKRRISFFEKLSKHCNSVVLNNCYGQDLDVAISRAKVLVNMHHIDGQPLEVVRLNYLMANECNIVSEFGPSNEVNEKYSNGLHFCNYENLLDACMYALDNPVSGLETIRKIPHSCESARLWLEGKIK